MKAYLTYVWARPMAPKQKRLLSLAVFICVLLSIITILTSSPAKGYADVSTGRTLLTVDASQDDSSSDKAVQTSTNPVVINGQVKFVNGTLNLIQGGDYDASATTKSVQLATSSLSSTTISQIKAKLVSALSNPGSSGTGITVDLLSYKIPLTEYSNGNLKVWIEDVINSNPDMFYLGTSFSYQFSGYNGTYYVGSITVSYSVPASSIASMRTKFTSALNGALSWIPSNATDAQKAKAAHDWLVRNCAYNTTIYNRLKAGDSNPSAWWYSKYGNYEPWTAYGALVSKTPVCQGYSLAFIAIMKHVGVTATFVENSSAGHGWNRVKIGSSWYNMDVTWDDPLPDAGFSHTPNTNYFLKSDSTFKSKDTTHKTWAPTGTASPASDYNISGLPTYSKAAASGSTTTSSTSTPTNSTAISMSSAAVKLSATSYTYSGANKKPTVTVTYGGKKLTQGIDYTVTYPSDTVNPGTKTVKVTGKGNYTGTKNATYTIKGSLSLAKVTAKASVAYTAKAQKVVPVVKFGNKTLKAGTDYTVTYPKNVTNPGKKTCTIKGKGAYTGSKTFSYTITKVKVAKLKVTYTKTKKYTKKAIKPAVTVKLGSVTLKKGTDYTVSYSNNVKKGKSAKIIIKGKNGITGTRYFYFTIK